MWIKEVDEMWTYVQYPRDLSRSFPYVLLYSREVVWPKHERKSNSRKMSLTTQALLHLAPSPAPMDVVEEQTDQTAHTDEPEEEQSIYNVDIFHSSC